MPKISIIVPVYNSEQHLDDCIKSLREQTLKDIEIILVDDGSTDLSKEICEENLIQDSRIKIISKENEGVSIARNVGIKKATGEYIMFCDSDDTVSKDWCEKLLNSVNGGYDLSVCGFKWINNYENNILDKIFCNTNYIYEINKKDFFKLREKDIFNIIWNKIFKANIIKENNILFDVDISLGEDIIFILDYMKYISDKIGIVNEPLYNYLYKDGTNLASKYRYDLFDVYTKIFNELYQTSIELDVDFNIYGYSFYKSYFAALLSCLKNTFRKENKENIMKKLYYNNMILQNEDFKRCAENMNNLDYNERYIKCLLKGNYFYVYIFEKLFSIKLRINEYLNG